MSTPENPMALPLTPTEAIAAMVSRWEAPDGSGIPFKGEIISADGCMCAQGQALHFIAGLTPDELREIEQRDADTKTMEIFGISRAHAILLRQVNDGQPGAPSVVLTEPEKVLGPEAQTVLAFWRHLDRMTGKDWAAARDAAGAAARDAAGAAAWAAARDAAVAAVWAAASPAAAAAVWDAVWDAARAVASPAARDAARAAAWAAARDAARAAAWAAAWATSEIQGASLMRKRGQPFYFLPLFGFATPEDALERSVGEGK